MVLGIFTHELHPSFIGIYQAITEGKIGDLGTARLVDTSKQSQMTKAPGTVVFMPPEALEDSLVIRYGKELDVFLIWLCNVAHIITSVANSSTSCGH